MLKLWLYHRVVSQNVLKIVSRETPRRRIVAAGHHTGFESKSFCRHRTTNVLSVILVGFDQLRPPLPLANPSEYRNTGGMYDWNRTEPDLVMSFEESFPSNIPGNKEYSPASQECFLKKVTPLYESRSTAVLECQRQTVQCQF